jgi:hypothetical protein
MEMKMARANSFSHIGTHAVHILARLTARNAVKEELKAQGVRVTLVPASEIAKKTRAFLDANPHLFEEALQRAWRMGLIDQVKRIDQTVFDDERRRHALMPEWQR